MNKLMRLTIALLLLACSVSAQDFLGGGCERGYVYKRIQHGDVSYHDCVPDPKYWNPPPDGHNPIWAASSYKRWTRIDSLWTFQIVETCDTVPDGFIEAGLKPIDSCRPPTPDSIMSCHEPFYVMRYVVRCRQDTVWRAK